MVCAISALGRYAPFCALRQPQKVGDAAGPGASSPRRNFSLGLKRTFIIPTPTASEGVLPRSSRSTAAIKHLIQAGPTAAEGFTVSPFLDPVEATRDSPISLRVKGVDVQVHLHKAPTVDLVGIQNLGLVAIHNRRPGGRRCPQQIVPGVFRIGFIERDAVVIHRLVAILEQRLGIADQIDPGAFGGIRPFFSHGVGCVLVQRLEIIHLFLVGLVDHDRDGKLRSLARLERLGVKKGWVGAPQRRAGSCRF